MDRDLRAAINDVDCGVLVVIDGIINLANPALFELFDLPYSTDWVGRKYDELVGEASPSMAQGRQFRARLRDLADVVEPVNEDVPTAAGRVLEREYLPVVADGAARGHISLYWDVSADRAAELDRIRRHRAEIIAQQLGVRAQRTRAAEAEQDGRTLAERNRSLTATDVLRKELLATASHELRTPLTSILSFSELLGDSADAGPEAKQFAEIIHRNAQRLLGTVESLLLLASLGSSSRPSATEEVDLAGLVGQALEDLRPLIDAAALTVTLELGEHLVVAGDPDAISRLFTNVIGNAVKYSDPGGAICVRADRDPSRVCVVVSDTGIGVPADEIDEVFGQFFRSSTARRSGRPGTGLGLSVARGIVAQHGGTIVLTCPPEGGTVVTISMPTKGCGQ